LSYCGLVDVKIRASDNHYLPVLSHFSCKEVRFSYILRDMVLGCREFEI
jgi:hypothetical protein